MHNYPGLPVGEFAIRPGADDGGGRSHRHRASRAKAGTRRGRICRSTRSWSARRSSTSCSRSWRAMSIRWKRRWSRSACSRPATPTMSFRSTRGLRGTARSLDARGARLLQKRIAEVVEGTARLYGATAKITYTNGYPVVDEPRRGRPPSRPTSRARSPATTRSTPTCAPVMGAEDFAFMLQRAAGRLHLRRQRRQRGPAPPGLRFQRRGDPGRHVLLGAARGDRAGGLKTYRRGRLLHRCRP